MMSYWMKHRIVVVTLSCLAIWPVCHPFVVARLGLSPRKGGGWAMYCVPSPVIHVQVVPAVAGDKDPRFATALSAAFARFEDRRKDAAWVKPDGIGALALRAYPMSPAVELVVRELRLNRWNARLECTRVTQHRYDRTAP